MTRIRAWQQTERRKEIQKEKDFQSEHDIRGDEYALKAKKVDLLLKHTHATGDVETTSNSRFNNIEISTEILKTAIIHVRKYCNTKTKLMRCACRL